MTHLSDEHVVASYRTALSILDLVQGAMAAAKGADPGFSCVTNTMIEEIYRENFEIKNIHSNIFPATMQVVLQTLDTDEEVAPWRIAALVSSAMCFFGGRARSMGMPRGGMPIPASKKSGSEPQ